MASKISNAVHLKGTLLIVIFLCSVCLSIECFPGTSAFSWEEPIDVPVWIGGDEWNYWTLTNEEIVESEDSTGISLELTFQHMSDNSTYSVVNETENVEEHVCYKQIMTGESDFYGLYDISGIITENGWFVGTSTSSGFVYRRTSDLALVKSNVDLTESITFYDASTGQVSATLGTVESGGSAELVANPPLKELVFPLSTGTEWDTQSSVTTTTTVPGLDPTESTTVYDYHNEVLGIESHTVDAGTFDAFEIEQSGTSSKDGNQKIIDQSAFFAPEAKNFIEKVEDGEKLKQLSVSFLPDLKILEDDISVRPESPSLDLATAVNATINNVGHEDSGNFKAELWANSNKVDTVDVTSIPVGGFGNVTFDWTPDELGFITIEVRLDPGTAVEEYLEDNNVASVEVEVTEARPDLMIRASYVVAPDEVSVETTATIGFKVRNDGNREAEDVVVRVIDGATPIGDDISFDTIASGEFGEGSVSWTPESKGFHTIIILVDPDDDISELSESNNDASVLINVIKPDYSFNMKLFTSVIEIKPNETVAHDMELKNTGNEEDTIDLEVLSVPDGWSVTLDKYGHSLDPGRKATVKIIITSPLNAGAGQFQDIEITGVSDGDPDFEQALSLPIDVLEVAGASLLIKNDEKSLEGDPGDTITCQFKVTNTGNAPDRFDISVKSEKQWSTTIDGATVSMELAQGEHTTVTVKTVIPDTASGGDEDTVTLAVVSNLDPDYEAESELTIKCIRIRDIKLSVLPLEQSVEPVKTGFFTAVVANNGNIREELTFELNSTPEFPGDWVVNLYPNTIVEPNDSENVNFTIRVPRGAREMEYYITLIVTSAEGVELTADFTLTVLRVYDLSIEVVSVSDVVKAGENLTYTVTVQNRGNEEETVTLELVNTDSALTPAFSEDEITLGPEESKEITLTIESDRKAKGTYTFEVKASIGSKEEETYEVELTVKEVKESPGFGIVASFIAVALMLGIVSLYRDRKR